MRPRTLAALALASMPVLAAAQSSVAGPPKAAAQRAAAGPGASSPRGAALIEARRASASIGVEDLDHPAWDAAPAAGIRLETAFVVHQSIGGTAAVREAEVRALRDRAGLLVRIEWRDEQADTARTPHRFVDAVALQFPRDGKAATPPFMGGERRAVNVWYWNAATNAAENLRADGFGTLQRLPTQDVSAHGRHAEGRWRVAFRRAWRSTEPGASRLPSAPGDASPIAFAVWQGGNDERDGFKAVTMQWQSLVARGR